MEEVKEFRWKSGQVIYKKRCECGKWILPYSTYCPSCCKRGERSPFYKKAHSLKTRKLWSDNRKGKHTKESNPNWKGGPKKPCPICGKEICKGSKTCYKCSILNKIGEKNPAWRGGTSYEEYGTKFSKKLKQAIKIRDNFKCCICNNSTFIRIHHIDYNKKHNNHRNLISLCWKCHPKTNHNREYWKELFIRSLNERGFNMNNENANYLVKNFPDLYSGINEPLTQNLMQFGWEHGDGWFKIIKKLSEKLTTLIKNGDCPELKAFQVKEKFGGLRFYTNLITDESKKAIDEAEKEASKTCELCGNEGELHHKGGWLKTLCSQCAQPLEYTSTKHLNDH